MLKYDNTVSSQVDGKPIYGAQVSVYTADTDTPSLATIFADEAGTTPLSQPILTDQLGYFAFYIGDGKYNIRVMTGAVEISRTNITMVDTLQLKQRALIVPVNEDGGTLPPADQRQGKLLGFDNGGNPTMAVPNSFEGPTGPANSTYTTLAGLKAAAVSNASYIFAPPSGSDGGAAAGTFLYQTAGAPYTADGVNIIKLDAVPLTTGALVRQGATGVNFDGRSTDAKLRETVSVKDARFAGGAKGNSAADDTAAFLACASYCEANGARMFVPCGTYKLTDTIPMRQSFSIVGEGTEKTIINMVSSTVKPVFDLAPANNVVILGARISDLQIRCSGGSAVCDGITIASAPTNSTIRQCQFDNLWIRDCRRGVAMAGVIYRNFFTNITVQGTSDIGVYSDEGFVDVTYNTFAQIEVTNVANGAWAYYIRSSYSTFDTMTSDGVAYFSSPAGVIRNYTTETVQATSFPAAAGNAVVTINQVQLLDNFTIRGVDPAKRSVALRIAGTSVINAMRMVGPHPVNALLLDGGSSGVVNTLQVDSTINQIKQTHSDDILNNWIFNACFQVTKRSMRYAEGSWTPTFTGWTTAPTVNAATYERIGNRVSVVLLAQGGVADPGAGIGGLPFQSATMSGGVAVFSTSDPTKRIANGGLGASASIVGGFGAVSMAGVYWNMSLEYRA